MKKYKVLRVIGNIITGISAIAFLLSMCIDLDHNPDYAQISLIIYIAISVAGLMLGGFLSNLDRIQGACIGGAVVTCAWLHNRVKRPGKAMKRCYRAYQKEGSYRNTFNKCKELYAEYLMKSVNDVDKKVLEVESE